MNHLNKLLAGFNHIFGWCTYCWPWWKYVLMCIKKYFWFGIVTWMLKKKVWLMVQILVMCFSFLHMYHCTWYMWPRKASASVKHLKITWSHEILRNGNIRGAHKNLPSSIIINSTLFIICNYVAAVKYTKCWKSKFPATLGVFTSRANIEKRSEAWLLVADGLAWICLNVLIPWIFIKTACRVCWEY